ncbi:DUF6350 family protein [Phycicoccus sp. SLBN-51]|uniref:cell division protein PerM n=1 Tax=Phycicoccus sp. SLBN-51 TaxID=2768447 RepID=UPI00114F472F|nr:DUF6350 family protein [Phycicoccus sp. SLBN-51]TQJ51953.1 hypothetical protein FBY26_3696 [Phycicoccus sp. SLBN-51]
MSVMDLLRGVPSQTSGGGTPDGQTPWHRPLLAGAGTALASALVVVLPALVAWVASPQSTVAWTDALGVGASLWLLAGGSWLRAGTASIAFVPLLLTAGVVAAAAWGALRSGREAVEVHRTTAHQWGLLPPPLVRTLGLWAGGYAACAALWAAVASASSLRPQVLGLVLPLVVVPAAAVVIAVGRLVARDRALAGPRWRRPDFLPDVVRRAVRPAAVGVGALLATGTAVVVLVVVLRFGQISHLHDELATGVVGGVVLTLAQVLCLPNLGLWALSFLAGTGFSVVEGASTTWTGSRSALMPMVPVLGALPDPGAFPGWLPALALVPVAVGALVGWRSLRSLALLSTTRTKLLVTGTAVALTAGSVGVLDVLAGSSLGSQRLSHMGAPAGAMTVALLVELAVGAGLVLAWDRWRLRR